MIAGQPDGLCMQVGQQLLERRRSVHQPCRVERGRCAPGQVPARARKQLAAGRGMAMNPESLHAGRCQSRAQCLEVGGLVLPRLDDQGRLPARDVQVCQRKIRVGRQRGPQQRNESVHARRMHGTLRDRDQFVAPHHPEPPACRRIPTCIQGDAIAIAEATVLLHRAHGLQHLSPAFQDALQVLLLLRDARNQGQRAMAAATAVGLAAGW